MYSSIPFGLAQCTVELPYVFVQCLLFGIISYWMIAFEATAGIQPPTPPPSLLVRIDMLGCWQYTNHKKAGDGGGLSLRNCFVIVW